MVEVTEADLAFERGSSAVGLLVGGHYSVETKGNTLWVATPEGTDAEARRAALNRWYRRELKAAVPALRPGRRVGPWCPG